MRRGDVAELIYLYAIVAPASVAAALLRECRLPGVMADAPLFSIEAAGLVAAVSSVPATAFDEEPLNALAADLERLTPYVVRHEEAVRALLDSAVIPMAFGTVYRTPEGVAAVLNERADEFQSLLARFQGRQEWGVKVIVNTSRLMRAAEQENDALKALAAEAAAASEGRAYLIARRRQRLLADAAAQLAADTVNDILHDLAALSAEAVDDQPGQPPEGAEQLVGKAAFLVDDAAIVAFQEAAAGLDQRYQPRGVRIELSGPWAPYSFVRRRDTTDV